MEGKHFWKDGGKTAGAPLPFATHAPLVFDKIGSGAKGSAGQRGAAKMRNYGAFSLPPRCFRAVLRCLCAFSLPLRIFATPCALPQLPSALPSAAIRAAFKGQPKCASAHFRYPFGAFSLPSATFRWF